MKKIFVAGVLSLLAVSVFSQNGITGKYRAELVRQDGNTVVFRMEIAEENNNTIVYILNAIERIRVTDVQVNGNSIKFSMPTFESSFDLVKNDDGTLTGEWTKGTSGDFQHWKVYAIPNEPTRFAKNLGPSKYYISGKWDVTITRDNGTPRKALAEFDQTGDYITGSFITPTGDYRYLEGVLTGDSLKLSTFDGAHAYTFYAIVDDDDKIKDGVFYSGYNGKETWGGKKNSNVKKPTQEQPTRLKKGESKLNFTFNDLNGNPVSINDDRFKNKVVVIQIMGSWCPNCLDETKFLSEYYNENRNRGVEVIALAYEYSTDLERSRKSLSKFQKLFNVQYPMLITGVTSTDEEKTEKTLPQLTPIRSFPTSIFLDKKGNVREIHGLFYGPGTKQYFEEYKKVFNSIINTLLKEKS